MPRYTSRRRDYKPVRWMLRQELCRVNLHHTFHLLITSASLFRRLGILDIDSYFHNRILRCAGHVARMPMSRAPRQLLSGWVSYTRPIGCPQMTWGRTLENALKSKGISKDFDGWIAIAKDRPKWRQLKKKKKTLSPVRLVLKVTFFCCYMPQWCFFVIFGEY